MKLKRMLATVLALAMLLSVVPMVSAAWDNAPTLALDQSVDGDVVTVTLKTTEATELSALQFDLTYPTDTVELTSTKKQLEKCTGFYDAPDPEEPEERLGKTATVSIATAGVVSVSVAHEANIPFEAGATLAVVNFKVTDNTKISTFTFSKLVSGSAGQGAYTYSGDEIPSVTYVPPHDHVYTTYVYNNDATCSSNGTETAKCDICGVKTDTRDVATDEYRPAHTSDGVTDCTKESKCTVCQAVLREAGQHTWDEGVPQTAPTCEAKGSSLFTCTVCGKQETRDVDPLGHDYVAESTTAPTCTEQGYTHFVCSHDASHFYDGDYKDALGHDLQYTASGNALYETCTRCDHGAENSVWASVNVANPSYPFTGEAIEPATFNHSKDWCGGDLTVVYEDNVNVGTATAKIAAQEKTALITFNITKAAAPELAASAVQTLLCDEIVTGEKDYTFVLNNVIAGIPTNAGTVNYKAANGAYGTSKVDGTTLTYTVPTAQAKGTTDSITVTVESTNYETATVTLNFEFKAKNDVSNKLSLYSEIVPGGQYDFLVLEPIVLYNDTINEEIANAISIVYTDGEGKQFTELTDKTPAGDYTFTATYEDSIPEGDLPGHIGTLTGKLTITKGWPTIGILGAPDKDYDGAAAQIVELEPVDDTYSVEDGAGYYFVGESTPVITWYAVDGEGAKTKLDSAPINVGKYNVKVSAVESANYQATSLDVDFEIAPRAVTIKVADATKEYGTEDPAFTGTVVLTDTDESGLVADGDLGTISYHRTEADAEKEGYGTVELTATYTPNANYMVEIENGTLTITKTQPTLKQIAKFENIEATYNGKAVTAEITAAEGVEGLGKITVKYRTGDAAATTKAPVNAGTYTVVASIAEGANYAAKDLDVGTLTIAKAERELGELTDLELYPTNLTATLAPTFEDLDKSAKIVYTSDNTAVVTVNAKGVVTAIGNGSAEITVAIAETENYNAAKPVTVKVDATSNPVLGVSAGELSAVLNGNKIVLAGIASAYEVELDLADGFTYNVEEKTVSIKKGEKVIATLTIDDSAVVELPADVTIAVIDPDVKNGDDETANDAAAATTVSGLKEAAAKQMVDEAAKQEASADADIKVELRMSITALKADLTLDKPYLSLDMEPEVRIIAVEGTEETELQGWQKVENLAAPVEVSIVVPEGFNPTTALADHDGDDKTDEAIRVKMNGNVAKFTVKGFSVYTLIEDDAEATITFAMNDGSEVSKTYTAADAYNAVALPTDAKSGYRFEGWTFEGVNGTFTNLSEELMAEIRPTAAATAQFKRNAGSPSGSSSGALYNVTAAATKNGQLLVTAKNATAGSSVAVNVKPDEGYKIALVKVTTASGKTVEVKELNGSYSFVMPSEDVTVEAEFAANDSKFVDVKSNAYYAEAVAWAVGKNITTGTTATTFSPDASCTRAQMVTFLWRAAGAPKTEVSTAFKDVAADAYYAQAVAWALDNGITNGKGKGLFDPNGTVTRAESITMLFRYAKAAANANVRSGFTDVNAYAYYFAAVDWAVNNGITNGSSATTFSPNADCVRAQIVTFLYRLLGDK